MVATQAWPKNALAYSPRVCLWWLPSSGSSSVIEFPFPPVGGQTRVDLATLAFFPCFVGFPKDPAVLKILRRINSLSPY